MKSRESLFLSSVSHWYSLAAVQVTSGVSADPAVHTDQCLLLQCGDLRSLQVKCGDLRSLQVQCGDLRSLQVLLLCPTIDMLVSSAEC